MRGRSPWGQGGPTRCWWRAAGSTPGAGAYTFLVASQGNVPPPPPSGNALVLGTTVQDSISAAGEQDIYSFSLAADSRLYFDSFTSSSSIRWSLTGPAGTGVSDRSMSSSDSVDGDGLLRLPAGPYTLTVHGSGTATGAYSFRLLDLASATPLTPGTPVSGTRIPRPRPTSTSSTRRPGSACCSTCWRGPAAARSGDCWTRTATPSPGSTRTSVPSAGTWAR